MKLFEITKEYEEIIDNLYDEEGNVNAQALEKLEQNEVAMEKKVIAVASYIKNMEAEQTAISEAKKAMAEREKRFKKRIENMEEYLMINMRRCEIKKISCAFFDIKLKESTSVNVHDESLLADEYKRTKIETVPDKAKMLMEMRNGVVIPGASLATNYYVEIR